MKNLLLAAFAFSTLVSISVLGDDYGQWKEIYTATESAKNNGHELAVLRQKYPDLFSTLPLNVLNNIYFVNITTKRYVWSGSTICKPNDARLITSHRAVGYSYRMPNSDAYKQIDWQPTIKD